jgi:hypothetical protein
MSTHFSQIKTTPEYSTLDHIHFNYGYHVTIKAGSLFKNYGETNMRFICLYHLLRFRVFVFDRPK